METATRSDRRSIVLWSAALLALAGAAFAADASLDRRVSVNLDRVRPAEAFRTLAQLAGLTATVDPAVDAPVTVRLENVRVRTLLDAVCESIGCRWEVAGSPAVLHVAALPGAEPKPEPARVGLRDPVDLHVTGADAREILRTFANLLDADFEVDPAVQGKVTLDINNLPLQQALDKLCQQAACAWALSGGENGARRLLKVGPKKGS